MRALFEQLLRGSAEPVAAADVVAWWSGVSPRLEGVPKGIDRAVLGGFLADRLGFAFAGGYQSALRVLDPSLLSSDIASFSVTEARGNHPRAIDGRVVRQADGSFVLTGQKRWATLAPVASVVLVVLAEAAAEAGEARPKLRALRVSAKSAGLSIAAMPETPFVPEVPHAALTFDGVVVPGDALLPGDGYDRYVKPFRTLEDLHVHAAALGYVLSVARRHAFGESAVERLCAALAAVCAAAGLDPSAAETHVLVAGILASGERLLADLDSAWASVGDAERERWHRDRNLFTVASQVREKRRVRAWQTLAGRH